MSDDDLSSRYGCGLAVCFIAVGLWLLIFIGVEMAKHYYG
ncbi:hypothetical protein SAMN05444164_8377 [Bradyrhizobium erythrophlei]|uniref:Uncharacterized protein n=1 Tax=Bradyrhizobium erythrophlei TaxID=1437360 RepID=A0A1H5JCY4_9BRAD|nr:hypothetical protein SAMN05444164_8377 [Bradyrhizobium erythrophlei]